MPMVSASTSFCMPPVESTARQRLSGANCAAGHGRVMHAGDGEPHNGRTTELGENCDIEALEAQLEGDSQSGERSHDRDNDGSNE